MSSNLEKDYSIPGIDSLLPKTGPISKAMLESVLRPLLGKEALAYSNSIFNAQIPGETGFDAAERMFKASGLNLVVSDEDRRKIPETGRVLIAGNHPNGIAEMGVFGMLAGIRQDVKIVLMALLADILHVTDETGIRTPTVVKNGQGLSGKGEIRDKITQSLEREEAVLMFPPGEMPTPTSPFKPREHLIEKPWKSGFIHAAEQTESPIIPVAASPIHSDLFYSLRYRPFGEIGQIISLLRMFREFKQYQGKDYPIKVGDPIYPDELKTLGETPREKAATIRDRVIAMAQQ